jgi:predicted RNA binding protein YcfA (HicA-like mRNA interferase family)
MKVRDILKLLADDGWAVVRTRGSHRQLKHPTKKGTVTVAGKSGLEIPIGTLKSIYKQSQLEGKE